MGVRALPGTAALVAIALVPACASVAPPHPRFVALFEQRSDYCTIHVVQDTRSLACFVTFQCGRQPVQALAVEARVCVP
jgi:hypothetical protein